MIKGFGLDIYNTGINFAWNTSRDELYSFLDDIGEPKEKVAEFSEKVFRENAGAVTVCFGDGNNTITVFNNEPNNSSAAHEIYHIACGILKPRGIEDEEAYAYLIGHITEMFYRLYLEDQVKTSEPSR